jgi:hypothetical protein
MSGPQDATLDLDDTPDCLFSKREDGKHSRRYYNPDEDTGDEDAGRCEWCFDVSGCPENLRSPYRW